MNQRSVFPICLSDEKLLQRKEEQYQKYLDRYKWSDDGCLQYVTALIRDEMGRTLVGWNKKHESWQIPSGKVEKGEDNDLALVRELGEETGFEVISLEYAGTSKVVLDGMAWQGHFYHTEIAGVLEVKEADTMEIFKWMGFVKSDNDLGFALSDGEVVVDDVHEILTFWHMFVEVYWLLHDEQYKVLMSQVSTPVVEQFGPGKYLQSWNVETKQLVIEVV